MKKFLGLIAGTLALSATPLLAAFSESSFNYGVMWEGAQKLSDFTGLSHIAMYAGDGKRQIYDPYWEGKMLQTCKQQGLTPVFYAYLIAEWDKHYGYEDCDVDQQKNHCTHGAELIRTKWSEIIGRYQDLARGVAQDYGTSDTSIWLIEPDFFQYSVSGDERDTRFSQTGGGIPDDELAGKYFNEIVAAIKGILPNAKIGVDISPWLNEGLKTWYDNFDKSKVDYLFNSGGRTQGNQERIRNDDNNLLTWAQASAYMGGKKIIADDGYGVGGGAENNYGEWLSTSVLNARISDGVIGLTLKAPENDFYTFAKNNPIALSGGNSGNNSSSSTGESGSSQSGGSQQPSSSSVALTMANLIDDFEDGDSTAYTGRNDTWFAFTDVGDKGASSIQNVKNATGYDVVYAADNGSKYMAGLKGISLNKGGNENAPYVSLGLDVNDGLVGCKTITYKYKGAGHNLKAVTKGDEEGNLSGYNYHKSAVNGSASWETATVAVSALKQETGWGTALSLNASNIVKLQWEVKGTATANSLYVDDLACDGMNIVREVYTPVKTVFAPAAENTTQNVVAGNAIEPIVFNYENVTEISVNGLPKGLSGVLNESAKTYTISGTVDAALGTHDYAYTVSVTGVDENTTATGIVKVTRAPLVTVFAPAAENTTQNVVAGNAIEPIVFNFENVTSISVDGLPKGLNAVLDEAAKTYTISGTVDATLGTHDYAYTVSVTGVDENTTATGIIKVTRAPLVTVFAPAAENTTQNVVAGQPIAPIVFNFENVTSISVDGLPKGLNAVLDEAAKTYTISGTVDVELGTHDYEYTVSVTGVDENATATGVIKVTRAPLVTVFAPAAENTTQNVVAGNAIEPIVFNYENVTEISVNGLPKGLNAVLDEAAKTYTISGMVDVELGTHDYAYTVSVTGVDENATATGIIKVTAIPEPESSSSIEESSSSVEESSSSVEESSSSVEESSSSVEESSSSIESSSENGGEDENVEIDAEWVYNGEMKNPTSTGVEFGQASGWSAERNLSKNLGSLETGRSYTVSLEISVPNNASSSMDADIRLNEYCHESESINVGSTYSFNCEFTAVSKDDLVLNIVMPGARWESVTVSGLTFVKHPAPITGSSSSEVEESSSSVESSSSEVASSSSEPESSSSEIVSSSSVEESSSSETSSSSVEESSSSVEESSSSEEPESSSSSSIEVVESSSSEVEESSSSVESSSSEIASSSSEPESSSSEIVSSSSVEESSSSETSSSSVEESSSSVEESSSSEEPESSSSSSIEVVESSSSEVEESSSSVESSSSEVASSSSEPESSSSENDESSSSTEDEESSSSSEEDESSSSTEEESSSSEDPEVAWTASQKLMSVTLSGKQLAIHGASNVQVEIFDMQGRPLKAFRSVSGVVNLESLATGSYIVRLRKGSNSLVKRISIR